MGFGFCFVLHTFGNFHGKVVSRLGFGVDDLCLVIERIRFKYMSRWREQSCVVILDMTDL